MGFFGKAVKGGIAAKLFSEARKPHNQQKAKGLLSSLRNRGGSGTGRAGTRPDGKARTPRRRP